MNSLVYTIWRRTQWCAWCAVFLVVAGNVFADTVNQQQNFFVDNEYDADGRTALDATLRLVSDHAYFYVEDAHWNSLSGRGQSEFSQRLGALAAEFDSVMYPKETALWGSEPNPGIDGDPHITVLLHEMESGIGGYFETKDLISRDRSPRSNVREMLNVNANAVLRGSAQSFLAHELQHLISANQKDVLRDVSEDVWLNELRSEYSITHVGLNDSFSGSALDSRVQSFLGNPSDSIVEWPNTQVDYGNVALFGDYLVEQYGTGVLSETLKAADYGIASLDGFFSAHGYAERFGDVFIRWMDALYVNNQALDIRYGYQRTGLDAIHVVPANRMTIRDGDTDYMVSVEAKPWQPLWYEFSTPFLLDDSSYSLSVTVDVPQTAQVEAGIVTVFSGGSFTVSPAKNVSGSATLYAVNGEEKRISRVAVFFTRSDKRSGFTANESSVPVSLHVRAVKTDEVEAQDVHDGILARRMEGMETYVLDRGYKRYLQPEVIAFYGQLRAMQPIVLDAAALDSYPTANYIRALDDERVYAVWPDGSKHWLNISGEQFTANGRDWNAVFIVNDSEINFYRTGISITK